MRFAAAAAVLGLAASVSASSNGTDVYVTEVVTAFTTYCPLATTLTHASQTYTVTEPTTLTITNCPGGCTITKPVYSSVVTACSTCSSSAPVAPVSSSTPAAAVTTSSKPAVGTIVPPVYTPKSNGTTSAAGYTPKASGTGAVKPSSSSVTPYTGAADKLSFGVVGMLAAAGLVAAL